MIVIPYVPIVIIKLQNYLLKIDLDSNLNLYEPYRLDYMTLNAIKIKKSRKNICTKL